ncbi:hypothetical protein NPIL_62211, partial [Nephila pilipes]
ETIKRPENANKLRHIPRPTKVRRRIAEVAWIGSSATGTLVERREMRPKKPM